MKYKVLVRNNDFVRAYTKGKSYVHAQVVMYVNKNRVGCTRIGITSSKKIGNAVTRNRARRVIRAAISEVLLQDVGGYDIVFVARAFTPKCKSWQVAKTIRKLLANAGLRGND
ncbi:MAG: ribonuclease P protein component [Oscillospiraceae bacterium]